MPPADFGHSPAALRGTRALGARPRSHGSLSAATSNSRADRPIAASVCRASAPSTHPPAAPCLKRTSREQPDGGMVWVSLKAGRATWWRIGMSLGGNDGRANETIRNTMEHAITLGPGLGPVQHPGAEFGMWYTGSTVAAFILTYLGRAKR